MFRIRPLLESCCVKRYSSHLLRPLARTNTLYTNKTYSTKNNESKIPSIKDLVPKNLIDEQPQLSSVKQKETLGVNQNKKWIIIGVLLTAFSLGTIFLLSPPAKKEEVKIQLPKRKKRPVLKVPATAEEMPKEVPYLLIGGGTASFTAFRAIKSTDPNAKVLIISNENFYPYMRPPLSKEIWFNDDKESVSKLSFKQWNGAERSLFYEPDDFYTDCSNLMTSEHGGVAVARGWTVTKLDVANKDAYLDDGSVIHFDKCLIATGAKPKLLQVFEAAKTDEKLSELIKTYRNVHDFQESYEMFEDADEIAIIGGGFLGSELACAMARKGKKSEKKIYQIFKESGNMGKILPEYLSLWTTDKVKDEGVHVLSESEVVEIKSEKVRKGDVERTKLVLVSNNGKNISVDYAVVAVGARPDTDLAESSGLEVDKDIGGYLVNTEMQARTDVYVAGDCACFYDTKLGRRRFEHHDHAVVTGRLAGENMAGSRKPYLHQSMFWSDLGPDIGYEAIGIVDSALPTVAVFAKATEKDNPKSIINTTTEIIRSDVEQISKEINQKESPKEADQVEARKELSRSDIKEGEDFGKGVVFYLRDGIVVGLVLWNVFNRMSVARQVLSDHKKYDDLNEVAKLFTIHEE